MLLQDFPPLGRIRRGIGHSPRREARKRAICASLQGHPAVKTTINIRRSEQRGGASTSETGHALSDEPGFGELLRLDGSFVRVGRAASAT